MKRLLIVVFVKGEVLRYKNSSVWRRKMLDAGQGMEGGCMYVARVNDVVLHTYENVSLWNGDVPPIGRKWTSAGAEETWSLVVIAFAYW